VVESPDGRYSLDHDRERSIGRVRAFYGNFGVLVRALSYILAHGGDGLRNATADAVLNANYIRQGLGGSLPLALQGPFDARSGVFRSAADQAGRQDGRYSQAID
jgi:glycine dehydrogenase subunit 2